jgi:serine/threonine protein kinase/tetratricopeptide (TPR) repeat protein
MTDQPHDSTQTRPPAEQPESALDAGLAVAFASEPAATPEEEVGAVIAGRYKLLERIGEGGMGSVWVAQQTEPVKRKVAVKLIKAGMDSRAVLARFEAERQALALMDHPNIARIFDGGVTDKGSPFFVMELVKGVPITQFCDARKLTPRERLELFVPVCQALQHAHQKGVIHRDIKPSNVLVALYDDKPVPKVIDFGVAKATGPGLTEESLNTGFGAVVGTPLYMSPEQATLNNLDIDTRSDVYSLGVLLYELLTGSPPFNRKELERAGMLEILRVIREEEPPRPSFRLSTADALPSLSASRGTEPKKLTGLLRNELDWIVMKALEKDRARRYETANGLAADVLRYLSGEPVNAHPPSRTYRMKKFLRKHKGPVSAASLVAFALVIGIIGTSIGLVRAEHERRAAEDARAAEAEQRDIAEKKEREAQREKAKALDAAEAERAAKKAEAEQRKAAEDATRRAFEALRSFTDELMEKQFASKTQLSENERSILRNALKQWEVFSQSKGETAEAQAIRAEGALRVATLQDKLGLDAEAEANYVTAVVLWEQLAANFPAAPGHRSELARTHNNLGNVLKHLGRRAEAEEHYRKAFALFEQLAADFPAVPLHRSDLAATRINLGGLLEELGKRVEAEEQVRKALTIREQLAADFSAVPEDRSRLAGSHNNLGILLANLGRRAEAEEQFRKALAIYEKLAAAFPAVPEHHSGLATTHNNLGNVLEAHEKCAESEEHYRKALALFEKLAADFPAVPQHRSDLANTHNTLGALFQVLGRRAEAEEQHRKALAICEKLVAAFPVPQHRSDLADTHYHLGVLLNDLGKRAEAEEQHRKALTIREQLAADFPAVPQHSYNLAGSHQNLGMVLANLGRRAEAEEQFRKALAIYEKLAVDFPAVPQYRSGLAYSHGSLGLLLANLKKWAEAEEQYRKVLALFEKLAADFPAVPQHRSDLAVSHNNLGGLLKGLGRRAEAEEQCRKALALFEKLAADFPAVSHYQVNLVLPHSW